MLTLYYCSGGVSAIVNLESISRIRKNRPKSVEKFVNLLFSCAGTELKFSYDTERLFGYELLFRLLLDYDFYGNINTELVYLTYTVKVLERYWGTNNLNPLSLNGFLLVFLR
jgi:hypothetical protein